MAITTGAVTVASDGSYTGSGLALELFEAEVNARADWLAYLALSGITPDVRGEHRREDLLSVWDPTLGLIAVHLDMLVSAELITRTITADHRALYATESWLDDMIAEEGYMACALSTVPRIEAASIESGRWVLMLGHELIAHASSLRALCEGSKPWPDGAVAWHVVVEAVQP